jgi:vacuolar-type H+-ATPase subunit I/STV1
MKERMKKLTLLVFYRDKAEITSALQELGVIHLETVPVEESGAFERLENDLAEWQRLCIFWTITKITASGSRESRCRATRRT